MIANKNPEKNTIKRNRKKKILYPVFIEASRYIVDDYWRNFFEQLAHNVLPMYFRIINNVIVYKNKKVFAEFMISRLENKLGLPDFDEEIEQLIDFFQKYGNTYSEDDLKRFKEYFSEKNNDFTWNKCSKALKFELLKLFMNKEKQEKNLDNEEFLSLKILLIQAFLNKELNNKDLELENKRIKLIKKLSWDEKTRKYTFLFSEDKDIEELEEVREKPKDIFLESWREFLNNILEPKKKRKTQKDSQLSSVLSCNSSTENT
jgi:hypothetical protein